MLKMLMRHGIVRVVGRRAMPVLLLWDIAVLANKARQIPVVDRGLRRGAAAAADRFAATLEGLTPQRDGPIEHEASTARSRSRQAGKGRGSRDGRSAPPGYPGE